MTQQITLFDYASVEPALAGRLQAAEERIKLRSRQMTVDALAIGMELLSLRDDLEHGQLAAWLESRTGVSYVTAWRWMTAAEKLGGKSFTVKDLPLRVIYEITAPTAPPGVLEVAVAKAEAGETVTNKTVKELKAALKEANERVATAEAELDEVSRIAAEALETAKRDAAKHLKEANSAYEEAAKQWRDSAEKADTLQAQIEELRRAPVSPEVETEIERLTKRLTKAEEDRTYYMESLADAKEEADELRVQLDAYQGNEPDKQAPRYSTEELAELEQIYYEKGALNAVETKGALTKAVIVGLTEAVEKARGISPERWAQVSVIVAAVLNATEQLRAAISNDASSKVVTIGQKRSAAQ